LQDADLHELHLNFCEGDISQIVNPLREKLEALTIMTQPTRVTKFVPAGPFQLKCLTTNDVGILSTICKDSFIQIVEFCFDRDDDTSVDSVLGAIRSGNHQPQISFKFSNNMRCFGGLYHSIKDPANRDLLLSHSDFIWKDYSFYCSFNESD
jgi:hypothetical protein